MLLDIAHDLLESRFDSSGQNNCKPNRIMLWPQMEVECFGTIYIGIRRITEAKECIGMH